MKKKTFDLICSVSELTGLFQKNTNIRGLLQIVVKLIARHMETEACSIFLYEESSDRLVLRATVGLNPEMIGQLKLAPGEGITGTSLKECKVISVPRGSEDPNFKHVPGILEEKYEAFLAVPILHSGEKLGVIALEDSRPGYYTKHDIRALTAIASQLAAFLENAKTLMELRNSIQERTSPEKLEIKRFYKGNSASGGVALGIAVVLSRPDEGILLSSGTAVYDGSPAALDRALANSKEQLEQLQAQMEENLSEMGSLIFGSHLLMLSDDAFSGSMKKIVINGELPCNAVVKVVNEYINLFLSSQNPHVQEKVLDLKDLGHRILKNLSAEEQEAGDYHGQIVVARDMLPSELVKLAAQHAEGFILFGSSATSHITILSRSLEIPTVFLPEKEFFSSAENKFIIIDGFQSTILVEPDEDLIEKFSALQEDMFRQKQNTEIVHPETVSADGTEITIQANINLLSDVKSAKKMKAKGIGLYRTEFMFLVRNDFVTEEEQFLIYERLLKEEDDVVFRTLDIGGDKQLHGEKEANPFMGLRGIRFSLKRKDIFLNQIRALLRAAKNTELKILFPFVAGIDDFCEAREMVLDAMKELKREKIGYNKDPKFGAMIELPSAALCAGSLAEKADFLSIGTNDLIQYTMGVDRSNEQVAEYYNPFHPSVLYLLKKIADGAIRNNCPLSVCGEAAGDPEMLRFLLGLGIRSFSVDPRSILRVKKLAADCRIDEAERFAGDLLALDVASAVEKYMSARRSVE